jgi:N-acetylglucosaminyldiphosphoundecaprenol N-acetyl-beta-D-mannosaminyltransferase
MNAIKNKEAILSCQFTTLSSRDVIDSILAWDNEKRPCFLSCGNPHSLVEASKDKYFSKALSKSEFLIPDGIGIVLASKYLGGSITSRLTGFDIFSGLSSELNKARKSKYFFLGSTDETLQKIKHRLQKDYEGIELVGTYSPPYKLEFSEEDNNAMIEQVNESGADVLWVGMTAPKQEKWILKNLDRLDVKFVGAIGAVFDFYAGNINRSPPIFQQLGLEWLPRLLQEPRRLWRRNFISTPVFIYRVFLSRFSGGRSA